MTQEQSKIISSVAVLLKTQVIDKQKTTIKALAKKCMLEEVTINEVLAGRPLSIIMAEKLERGTGIPLAAWMVLNENDIENSEALKDAEHEAIIINIENFRR